MPTKPTRLKAETDIRTRADFERLLDAIAADDLAVDALVVRLDEAIARARADYAGHAAPLEERLRANLLRAGKYAETHRAELFPGDAKTASTAQTDYGFRLGTPALALLNRNWNWKKVIETLESKGFGNFVETKKTPDKDAMKTQLNDEQLASVGTRITQSERFFVAPKREKADESLVGERKEAA